MPNIRLQSDAADASLLSRYVRRYQYKLSLTPKGGGESNVMSGQGIHILKRESDGSWRFVKDMWS